MLEINHGDRAHSNLGASSTDRWMNCPASVQLTADMPEEPESPFAREGTIAHELAEHCLVEELNPMGMVGEEFEGIEVPQEMADAVKIYTDFIEEVGGEGKELFIEQRFQLSHIDDELFGTNDACVAEPFGTLYVIDFKYGKGIPVEAEENKQLMYYAIGAAYGGEYADVELVIVQPRCPHPEGAIRRSRISLQRLEKFEKELTEAVAETRIKDPKFGPTEKGCKWCKAKATCPALKNKSLEVAKAEFDDADQIILPDPKNLTDEEIGRVLKYSKLIGEWVKSVEKHAYHQADNGHAVTGYKLVKKRANRKWSDESKVVLEFGDIFGDSIYEKKLLTPAKLEKIIGKPDVAKLTTTPDGGTTLVPLSDKRNEVKASAVLDFGDEI